MQHMYVHRLGLEHICFQHWLQYMWGPIVKPSSMSKSCHCDIQCSMILCSFTCDLNVAERRIVTSACPPSSATTGLRNPTGLPQIYLICFDLTHILFQGVEWSEDWCGRSICIESAIFCTLDEMCVQTLPMSVCSFMYLLHGCNKLVTLTGLISQQQFVVWPLGFWVQSSIVLIARIRGFKDFGLFWVFFARFLGNVLSFGRGGCSLLLACFFYFN